MGGGNRRDAEHLQVSKAAICSTEKQTLSLQQERRKGLIPEAVLYPLMSILTYALLNSHTNTHPTQTFVKLFKNDT